MTWISVLTQLITYIVFATVIKTDIIHIGNEICHLLSWLSQCKTRPIVCFCFLSTRRCIFSHGIRQLDFITSNSLNYLAVEISHSTCFILPGIHCKQHLAQVTVDFLYNNKRYLYLILRTVKDHSLKVADIIRYDLRDRSQITSAKIWLQLSH